MTYKAEVATYIHLRSTCGNAWAERWRLGGECKHAAFIGRTLRISTATVALVARKFYDYAGAYERLTTRERWIVERALEDRKADELAAIQARRLLLWNTPQEHRLDMRRRRAAALEAADD